MTAISPLQSVHKKGLFGDHYKKNEKDLLNITEVTNLIIVQIVHYKNSKINLDSISIDGLKLSLQSSKVTSNKDTRILWNAPNIWLVLSQKEDIVKIIKESCDNESFATTDISHSRAIIKITGSRTTEVLKKGCPINFNEFKKNNCAGSVFHGINIVIDCIDDEFQNFNLLTLRSFGESLYHHITDASLEFGYVGV
jgi:sarcosine oxidase subunit gamma